MALVTLHSETKKQNKQKETVIIKQSYILYLLLGKQLSLAFFWCLEAGRGREMMHGRHSLSGRVIALCVIFVVCVSLLLITLQSVCAW